VSDKYLGYKELSKRWGVARNTLCQWVMEGILVPTIRLGRLVRFSESYILEIESRGGIKHAR
jgi:predicted site-specific integrase-resolvase